jgi:hypothetical protein
VNLRVAITIVATLIAVDSALLGLATQQPPIYPFHPLVVVLAVLLNAGLAVLQTQLSGWRDAAPETRTLIDQAQVYRSDGHDPVRLINLGHIVEEMVNRAAGLRAAHDQAGESLRPEKPLY